VSRAKFDFAAVGRATKERDDARAELAELRKSEAALRSELQLATGELCLALCMRSAPESKKHTTGCRRRTNVLAGVLL
jgi:hypothetical protein